jgi:hypothetical protein
MATLTSGSLAYYDSFAGLVPCKIESIKIPRDMKRNSDGTVNADTQTLVYATLTASRRPYQTGERVHGSSLRFVPRDAVHVSSGQYQIWPYTVQA